MLTNETDRMLADGGVMQQGGTTDPVSGNDVPPGAMQEEVRDDIDAKLSEGEFVIPADVVRYIGLSTLMKMRDKAKEGLKKMQDIGQMGNAEEVEDAEAPHGEVLDDEMFGSEIDSILNEESGGEEREYAEGGVVVPERQPLYRTAPMRGFEMVPMSNDLGQTIYIPFINGVAQLNVPAGYKAKSSVAAGEPVTAAPTTPAVVAPAADSGGDGGGDGDTGNGTGSGTTGMGGLGLGGFSMSDEGKAVANTTGFSNTQASLAGTVASMVTGIPGLGLVAMGLNALSNFSSTQQAAAANEAFADTMGVNADMNSLAATSGIGGTGGSAASAATSAASAASAAGFSDQAAAAAGQAAANASMGGASASEAANAGAAAAQSAQADAAADATDAEEGAAMSGGGGDSASSAGMGGASEGSAGSTAGDSSSPDGPDGSNAFNTGGFVSKRKKSVVTNKKSLASRK